MGAKNSYITFKGGMVIDSDPSIKKKDTYELAENLRFIADSNTNTGALYVPESSILLNTSVADQLQTDERIIGHCVIRDYLVLFTRVSTPGDFEDNIIRFTIDGESLTDKTIIATSTDWLIDSNTKDGYISTVGRYDSPDNIRVYFATKGKSLRVINITEVFSGDIGRLNIIPISELNSLGTPKVTSGRLPSGKVQYAYSLYKRNSQETIISPLTLPVPVYSDGVESTPSCGIKGDSEAFNNTGKGFILDVSLNSLDASYFDYLRLYRVQYNNYLETPSIGIVNDFIISSQTSFSVTDTGETSLGELSIEDFSILSSTDFNAYDIEEKDNYLFAGNIEDNTFDVDYDARAYRFTKSTSTQEARLYSSYDGSYSTPDYVIDSSGNVTDNTGGGVTSWEDIPQEAACVNPYNDFTYWNPDSPNVLYEQAYRASGIIAGGDGPNVSYSFTTHSLTIDNSVLAPNPKVYGGNSLSTGGSEDYSNPYIVNKYTGYQRNEVYRFGIEFFNDKGQNSSVKWVGDIRMPCHTDSSPPPYSTIICRASGSVVTAHALGITFNLTNIPSEAVAYRIVRVKRTVDDRSVVTAGMVSITSKGNDPGRVSTNLSVIPMINPDVTTTSYDPITASDRINDKIISFVDPYSVFSRENIIKQDYWLENTSIIKNAVTKNSAGTDVYPLIGDKLQVCKYKTVSPISYTSSHTFKYTFPDTDSYKFFRNANSPLDTFSFTSAGADGYFHKSLSLFYSSGSAGDEYLLHGEAMSCNVIDLETPFDVSAYSETSLGDYEFQTAYTYLMRNNLSRYGGYTFTARNNNEYIPCGDKVDVSTSSVTVFGGDTYINYFNYTTCIYNDNIEGGSITDNQRTSTHITFPVESPYNLSLRNDLHYSKVSDDDSAFMIYERGSATERSTSYGSTDYKYKQEDDLYLYNTVYSQEQSVGYNYSIDPTLFTYIYDTRVLYSDKKFSNELIDSWTKFRPNNFLEASSQYGPVYSLKKYNNEVYFHQENGFGQLFINQRSLVNDDNLGSLSLGTGGVLESYKYISTKYGTDRKTLVSDSSDGIYFYDINRESILKYNGQGLKNISDVEGLRSYIRNITTGSSPIIVSNAENNEVYFALESGKVLVYNNFIEKFTGIYTIDYSYLLDLAKYLVLQTSSEQYLYGMYLDKTKYGSFDTSSYTNSTLTVTFCDDFTYTKVFDNLFWYTTCKDGDAIQNNTTFDNIQCWNDYQYTGSINLSSSNLRKSERKFFHPVGRNIINDNGTGNIDVFTASTKSPSERMRGEYLTVKFTFNNSAGKGQLSVPYIGIIYRQSNR